MAKKKPPTEQQIKAEAEKLAKMKPNIRRTSMFGDNHHDAIDAQIEVLTERLDDGQCYDRWGDDEPENVRSAALEAVAWLEGDGEQESLTAEWQELLIVPETPTLTAKKRGSKKK